MWCIIYDLIRNTRSIFRSRWMWWAVSPYTSALQPKVDIVMIMIIIWLLMVLLLDNKIRCAPGHCLQGSTCLPLGEAGRQVLLIIIIAHNSHSLVVIFGNALQCFCLWLQSTTEWYDIGSLDSKYNFHFYLTKKEQSSKRSKQQVNWFVCLCHHLHHRHHHNLRYIDQKVRSECDGQCSPRDLPCQGKCYNNQLSFTYL